jgi:hypothetical protein
LEKGEFENSVGCFERVLQLGSGIPATHFLLGIGYLKLGKAAAALGQCELLQTQDTAMERELREVISSSSLSAEA